MKLKLATVTLVSSLLLSSNLFAEKLDKVSFYVNYKPGVDATAYALYMQGVSKVYTHKAGDSQNVVEITSQFETLPTFSDGQLCFGNLAAGASGENGATDAAGSCFNVVYYYIQKEGSTFLLYNSTKKAVQEGTAGDATSFIDKTSSYPDFYLDETKGTAAATDATTAAEIKASEGSTGTTAILPPVPDGSGIPTK